MVLGEVQAPEPEVTFPVDTGRQFRENGPGVRIVLHRFRNQQPVPELVQIDIPRIRHDAEGTLFPGNRAVREAVIRVFHGEQGGEVTPGRLAGPFADDRVETGLNAAVSV